MCKPLGLWDAAKLGWGDIDQGVQSRVGKVTPLVTNAVGKAHENYLSQTYRDAHPNIMENVGKATGFVERNASKVLGIGAGIGAAFLGKGLISGFSKAVKAGVESGAGSKIPGLMDFAGSVMQASPNETISGIGKMVSRGGKKVKEYIPKTGSDYESAIIYNDLTNYVPEGYVHLEESNLMKEAGIDPRTIKNELDLLEYIKDMPDSLKTNVMEGITAIGIASRNKAIHNALVGQMAGLATGVSANILTDYVRKGTGNPYSQKAPVVVVTNNKRLANSIMANQKTANVGVEAAEATEDFFKHIVAAHSPVIKGLDKMTYLAHKHPTLTPYLLGLGTAVVGPPVISSALRNLASGYNMLQNAWYSPYGGGGMGMYGGGYGY